MKTFRKTQGMQVATLAEGAIIGKLDDFQFDLETAGIYGYRLKGPGVFAKSGGVPAAALTTFGRDLVFIRAEGAVEWGGSRNAEDHRAWASEYRGSRVMSRRGEALGQVEDFVVEAEPPRVLALLLDGNRIVPLDGRVATGRDAVILDDAGVAKPLPETEPDSEKWWTRVRGMFGGDEPPSKA